MAYHELKTPRNLYICKSVSIYPTLFIVDSFQVIKTDMGTI